VFFTDTGGTGVAVVLMHAATGSVRSWEYQTPAFVKAGYRVIAFDRRGWGRTPIDPNAPAGTAADDLIALMDSLHLDRVHLVGTAAGDSSRSTPPFHFPPGSAASSSPNSIGGVQDPEFGRAGTPPASRGIHRHAARTARGVAVVPGRRILTHPSVGRAREDEPRAGCASRAAAEERDHVRSPGIDPGAGASSHRRCRHVCSAACIEDVRDAHEARGNCCRARGRTFDVLEQPDAFNKAVLTFIRKH